MDDEAVAVCMMPGTEIAFAHDVRVQRTIFRSTVHQKLARFRKINEDQPNQHHDALEFADGTVVLVNDLLPGQQAMVLQLPADAVQHGQEAERKTEAAPIAEPETERI
ncbi:hypothetical protein NP284_22185 [Rhodopseudomonas pseudopalustris]